MGRNILRCMLGSLSISIAALIISSLAVPPVIFLKSYAGNSIISARNIYLIIIVVILALCALGYYFLGKSLKIYKEDMKNIIPVVFFTLWNILLLSLTYIFQNSNPELSRFNYNIFCLFNAQWMSLIIITAENFIFKSSIVYSVFPSLFIYLGVRKIQS